MKLLRDAGAREIHMRISAPPFFRPLFITGTDIDSEEILIACRHSTEEIAELIGADSLGIPGGGNWISSLPAARIIAPPVFMENILLKYRLISGKTGLNRSCLSELRERGAR